MSVMGHLAALTRQLWLTMVESYTMVDDSARPSRSADSIEPPAPDDGPDFGILLMLAARALADDLNARLAAEGFPALRAGFGFMFRAIRNGAPTPGELANRLGVSKQAVGKMLDEMEQRGFVERRPDPADLPPRRLREWDACGLCVLPSAGRSNGS